MKKTVFIPLLIVSMNTKAQQTNNFPNTGNVSIGVGNAPEAKLHIYEETSLGSAQNSYLLLSRTSGNYGVQYSRFVQSNWLVRHTTGNAWTDTYYKDGLSIDASFLNPTLNVKTWWDRDPYNNSQSWGTDQQTYMSISQGKVGVNINYVASPLANRAKLQVEETNGNTKAFVAKTTHGAGYGYCIVADVDNDNTYALKVIHRNFSGIGQSKETFGVYGNGQTVISTKATDAFIIQDVSNPAGPLNFIVAKSGKTQIGSRGPNPNGVHNNAMLSVDGKVIAKSFYVTIAPGVWADYVFDKEHKLMTINETERFIKEFKHLPGVPSAKEIETNGMSLEESNIKLLEKLEEAYLYIIELNKRVELLENKK